LRDVGLDHPLDGLRDALEFGEHVRRSELPEDRLLKDALASHAVVALEPWPARPYQRAVKPSRCCCPGSTRTSTSLRSSSWPPTGSTPKTPYAEEIAAREPGHMWELGVQIIRKAIHDATTPPLLFLLGEDGATDRPIQLDELSLDGALRAHLGATNAPLPKPSLRNHAASTYICC